MRWVVPWLVILAQLIAPGREAFAQHQGGEAMPLWDLYNSVLKNAKYIDLTHAIAPGGPIGEGFADFKAGPALAGVAIPGVIGNGEPFTYEKQGVAIEEIGFNGGAKPWLPVAPDYTKRNVAAEMADPNSVLSLYRTLIAQRRTNPAMAGDYRAVDTGNPQLLAYQRNGGGRQSGLAGDVRCQQTSQNQSVGWKLVENAEPVGHQRCSLGADVGDFQ